MQTRIRTITRCSIIMTRTHETLAFDPVRYGSLAVGRRELRISNADYRARPFFVTTKSPTARRQLHPIRHWGRYDPDALDDRPEDVTRHLRE